MKKSLLIKISTLALSVCSLLCIGTACKEEHTHSYIETLTAPTCTEQGFTTYTCSCGNSYVDDYVEELGHSFIDYNFNDNATCTENGTETATCSRVGCQETDTRTKENSALNHDFTDYISDNNATYTSDGTKTASCNRNGCNEKDTVTETGTKLASGISFKTLSVTGTDVYGKVSNATETFSFINEVAAVGTAKFVVSLDIYGSQQVATKTISLNVGDNKVYIIEVIDDEPKTVYEVVVRRRQMYDITFSTDGGTSVLKQVVEEDYLATKPETTRTGYTFKAWDYDFAMPITKNTVINASWTAHTDTPYKVEYYLQNLEDDNYTIKETANKTGTTDTTANAEIKTFAHFTHKASATDSGNINGDGSTILKVYYTRNKYTLSVDNADGGGTITNTGTYKYGTIAQVSTASVYLGYDFGWYHGDTLLSTDLIYTFTVEQDIIAKFTVKTEMSNFDFTATATACQITGVKNKAVVKIVVPDFVTSIDGGVFSGCSRLQEIALPFVGASKNATSASSSTLFGYIFGTSSYTGGTATKQYYSSWSYTYYVPTSLKLVTITGGQILYGAFYNCSGLTSVEIGDNVTSIGWEAFENCSSLTSVEIGDSVTRIWDSAFSACSSLTSVTIGDSVTSIGECAFEYCESLTSITIGDSVTSIGEYAFSGCSSLTSITIGDSVTSIGSYAFAGCSSLTSIIFKDTSIWYKTTSSTNWRNKTGGTSTSVTKSSTNATLFKSTYGYYYWYKL